MKLNRLKNRFAPFFIILSFISTTAFSQGTVTGTVSDEFGEPIPGATVLETGTQNGVVSDFDGKFSITLLKSPSELTISSIGFDTQKKTVSASETLTIVLAEGLESLNEVVVIGYGTSKRSDVTMAVSSVGSKSFKDQPIFRAEDALQSRAAGVQLTKSSGAPGGEVKLRIRGTTSINRSSSPLIVIDGVIGGSFSSLNPNDIKSIDILKDASASAIYGARGANGVVLVTTKKGGGEPKIDVNYFTSISSIPSRIDVLSPQEFADIHNLPLIDNGTDLQDEFFQTSIVNNLQVSASGQEGKLKYFLSGNYVDEEGIVINTGYERFGFRANLETKLNDKLKIGLNISGSRTKGLNLFESGARASSDNRGGILSILTYNPTIPTRNADGTYFDLEPQSVGSILVNPIAVITEANNNSIADRLGLNLNLSYDFTPAFSYKLIAGTNIGQTRNENYTLVPDGSSVRPPQAGFSSETATNSQISNILTYNKDLGNTNVILTGVYEVTKNENKTSGGNSGDFSQDGIPNAFYLLDELGTSPSARANKTENTIQSFIGRAQVKVGDNFNISGALRVDQSSTFREENNTGYFPSVSASYAFKDLFKLEDDTALSNITLRAGWGQVGNDGSALGTFGRLSSQVYSFDGATLSRGLGYDGLVDPNLKWEATEQINFGLDFVLLKNRLNLSIDWYDKNSVDLLFNAPLPQEVGDPDGEFTTNLGEINNTGVDINLDAVVIDNDNLFWNANFNLSTVKNEVISLGNGVDEFLFTSIGNSYAIQTGQPIGQMWGRTFLGTYTTAEAADGVPGSSKYAKDENGDDVFGVIGNGVPTLTWGFNNTLTYKGFNLNVLIRGVHGFDVYNDTYGFLVNGKNPNHKDYLNRWTPDNETGIPSIIDQTISSRFVEKGDFIRLSNLTLGYTFRDLKLVKSLQVFASGQNLYTLTDYSGFDPEVSASSSSNDTAPSLDRGAFPNPRTISLGLNLTF